MRPNNSILRTRDGQSITIDRYLPTAGGAKRVLIIAPEAGSDLALYQPFTGWCLEQGIIVYLFNYRGMDGSAWSRDAKNKPSLHQWANQDLDTVLSHVRRSHSTFEITLLAHGLSGQIAGLAATLEQINHLVLVGSALQSQFYWPLESRVSAWLKRWCLPEFIAWAPLFLPFPEKLPLRLIREVVAWSRHPNGLFDIYPDNHCRRLRVPLLAFSFSDDPWTPRRAVEELLTHYSLGYTQWEHIHPQDIGVQAIGHDGFFYPESQKLWGIMHAWMQETIMARGYFF